MSNSVMNPITFSEQVNQQYLRYRLSRLPLKDPSLAEQARDLVGKPDKSPFIKGPYVSLSRPWKRGKTVEELTEEDPPVLHPHMHSRGVAEFPRLMLHQEEAARAAAAGRNPIISTGTGSGKTEAFLYPLISRCLELKEADELDGVVGVLVYPMNALANDQRDRLRRLLAGTGISFGLYTGSTPNREQDADQQYDRMDPGEDRAAYEQRLEQSQEGTGRQPIPDEERPSQEEMREDPPNILITNAKQLELLLTRVKDVEIFADNTLEFIVVDEAHTFSGVHGSEVAMLIRRLREFCGVDWEDVVHIGTSATIVDPAGDDEAAAERFASRFFGIPPETVELISESFEEPEIPTIEHRPGPIPDADERYNELVGAIESDDAATVTTHLEELLEVGVDPDDLEGSLYEILSRTHIVQLLQEVLEEPAHLETVIERVWERLGRGAPDGDHLEEAKAEVLLWLALGAAARKDEDFLFRPKVHYFVRGVEGAVAYFRDTEDGWEPILAESRRDGMQKADVEFGPDAPHLSTRVLDIYYCKDCGQHYFAKHAEDLHVEGERLAGGQAGPSEGEQYWLEDETGPLALFTDNLPGVEEDELSNEDRDGLHVCAACGLLQRGHGNCLRDTCDRSDTLVAVTAIAQDDPTNRCISCGSYTRGDWGRNQLVPARAVQVADVHILAQETISGLPEDHQKLLLFADSRQDAAFQAAWMSDHARSYRLRQLIYEHLEDGTETTVGDLVHELIDTLDDDPELLENLAPELIDQYTGNREGQKFIEARRRFFHIKVLREFAESRGRTDSLENWGLVGVGYAGLNEQLEGIQSLANTYGLDPQAVADFATAFLDHWRMDGYVHSPATGLYSRSWDWARDEVQNGWISQQKKYPRGVALERPGSRDDFPRLKGAVSTQPTWGMQRADRTFDDLTDTRGFIGELWSVLTDGEYLIQTDLEQFTGNTTQPMAGTEVAHQVNEEKLRLRRQRRLFKCTRCGEVYGNRPPNDTCMEWNCTGTCELEEPSEEVYDVSVILQGGPSILIPEEHTAQVPNQRREEIERSFKEETAGVNCIVATPTLELGVDIGDLDVVLLRNVPPTPSNYWQRAGRAGRRERMAVVFTYARTLHHDTEHFNDPLKMLKGSIAPPRINLRNDEMVHRHVNATSLSVLRRLTSQVPTPVGGSELEPSTDDRERITEVLDTVLPDFLPELLFEKDGQTYRDGPPDMSGLEGVLADYESDIESAVEQVLKSGYWPDDAQLVVDAIQEPAHRFRQGLEDELADTFRSFRDARRIRDKYGELRQRRKLSEDEQNLLEEAERFIDHLSERRNLETYLLNVLAASGFLPGYGFYEPGVKASYASDDWRVDSFDLTRPGSMAVREFVPGNRLYANGGEFTVSKYWFPTEEDLKRRYVTDLDRDVTIPSGETEFTPIQRPKSFDTLPVSDCSLSYRNRVTDDDEFPFRMASEIQLIPLGEGFDVLRRYDVGDSQLLHYQNMDMAFVNLGPRSRYNEVASGTEEHLGFPVCLGCGSVRSPNAPDETLESFMKAHEEEMNHGEVDWFGLEAEISVDYLSVGPCEGYSQAISLGWALILGAMEHIELEPDDLEVRPYEIDDDRYSAWIVDGHPGGSGLLDQFVEYWDLITADALDIVADCPSNCDTSCSSCLRIYENQREHEELDRFSVAELLAELREDPTLVGQRGGTDHAGVPAGDPDTGAVRELAEKLQEEGVLRDAELDPRIPVEQLGHSVRPDLHWLVGDGQHVCVYVDGSIHDTDEVKARDERIRRGLEDAGWEVYVIRNEGVRDPAEVENLVQWLEEAFDAARQDSADDTDPLADLLFWEAPEGCELDATIEIPLEGDTMEVEPAAIWEIPGRPKVMLVVTENGREVSTEHRLPVFSKLAKEEGWRVKDISRADAHDSERVQAVLEEIQDIIA